MYIKRNNFDTFEELEDLGEESEIELAKPKIRVQVLQITETRTENKKTGRYTTRLTINMETKTKILEMRDNKIYLEPRGYNKDIISHIIKYLLYRDPTPTLHYKVLINQDFHKVSSLDSEIINIDISTTLVTK